MYYTDVSITYECILFDLDGTLTDPKAGITKSFQYALSKLGIQEDNLDSLEKVIGPPLMTSFKEYYSFSEDKARLGVGYYREYFAEKGIFENQVYPEIPELLSNLKAAGRRLFVATSKPTVFAERILEHFDIMKHFSFIAGSNLDGTRCEKDEVIGYLMSNLDCSRGKTVMIGDRRFDIIGARKNLIDSIGVTYGYGPVEEIASEKPTHIANSVVELAILLGA